MDNSLWELVWQKGTAKLTFPTEEEAGETLIGQSNTILADGLR